MSKAETTKDALLTQARILFWGRGYSNVSLREIARASGVDVALVSRYFGSKQGLFEATLADIPVLDRQACPTPEALTDRVVAMFVQATRGGEMPSPMTMILTNATDADVGASVRAAFDTAWQEPLEQIFGDKGRAALFVAAMFGMSVAEKVLRLDGIAAPDTEAYVTQFRALLAAATEA